ncbi:copper amine oxidase N-terminal domain-containing protein [Bacillus infantis]|uniref:copper amine oxidase N-terminal domain-containing protein n=1 Tax=Bacillus infantis TaxID=324767 RepID=UPI001CD39BC1|nr:copper amine oxidase N-terminal domain-containing protein [Bacillus infantis]MCA1040873.1 copper amine oxidase N-terminal domain-containing protein [Bacillus infantis]
MKLVLSLFVLMLVFAFSTSSTEASSKISIYLDGEKQAYSNKAVISQGAVLVPLRGIFEALGAKVNWNQQNSTIDAAKGDIKVWLKIGSRNTKVNGKAVSISVPAQVRNGNTLVPLRFISESLGEQVRWNNATKTVKIGYDAAASAIGTYEGWYVAGQGKTGLTLKIEDTTAIFKFYPLSENPGVKSGEFEMDYEYNEDIGYIELKYKKWIKQPSGYNSVGMSGIIENGIFKGALTNTEASSGDYGKVYLERVE